MILDSSAIMAVLEDEPDADRLLAAAAAGPCRMSLATYVELGIVADSRSTAHGFRLDRLLAVLDVTLEPVDAAQARIARAAYRRFGRGSGSPARLNFGDCFSYALAVVTGEPLLFTGNDFAQTDIPPALS